MSKASKLELKAERCLSEGEYYEAHQIYRTMYYRLLGQNKFAELCDVLVKGVENLVKAGQETSAVDLCELYADALCKGSVPCTQERVDEIAKVLAMTPSRFSTDATMNSNADRRNKFISTIVNWSQLVAVSRRDKKRGLPQVHNAIASVLRKEKKWEASRQHYLLAQNPQDFAVFLAEMHLAGGFASEVDLFVALPVLQLLCLRRAKDAATLLQSYCAVHSALNCAKPPYPTPLLNMLNLLILAIPKHNVTHFSVLVDKYAPVLAREPSFKAYLDKIGQIYFGIQPPNTQRGGLFGNLLKGIMGDEKKESEEEMTTDSEEEGEAMDQDGYDTAPEDKSSTVTAQPTTAKQAMNMSCDDLD